MDGATIEAAARVAERFAPVITRGDKLTPMERAAIAQANAIAAAIRALAVQPCGHPRSAITGRTTHCCALCEAEDQGDDADTDALTGWAGALM